MEAVFWLSLISQSKMDWKQSVQLKKAWKSCKGVTDWFFFFYIYNTLRQSLGEVYYLFSGALEIIFKLITWNYLIGYKTD